AFLATGAFERISDRLNDAIGRMAEGVAAAGESPAVLDVGCGEGYYTRRLADALDHVLADPPSGPACIAGVDLSRPAVAVAAKRHRRGWYAVASAFDVPVPPASIDIVMSVFGPIATGELVRIVRPGGAVVAAHPGPAHLFALRQLVYEEAVPHEVKDPLRSEADGFRPTGSLRVTYPLRVPSVEASRQLLHMTPYRWHAGRDIDERLSALGGLSTEVDVVISTYERTGSG
ncbi:MAG TPA: methyltransferase domain-containing protein, partial [Acidimicrobiales bacterium]|nr:methyltransferase domain-containing protein [Acidimicrobiales bacterium]